MINDPVLRWIVTLLFLFSAGVCIVAIVRHRHSPQSVIANSLHAVMALAMAVMAWPRGAELPPRAPMIFFLVAAGWFAVGQGKSAGHRVANAYHAMMMLAMAWMYAAMGGLPIGAHGQSSSTALSGSDMAGMSGSDMAGMSGTDAPAGHAGHGGHGGHMMGEQSVAQPTTWVGALNWLCTIVFAVAAVIWLYRFITVRVQSSGDESASGVGILCQFAMAAGMSIMFGVML